MYFLLLPSTYGLAFPTSDLPCLIECEKLSESRVQTPELRTQEASRFLSLFFEILPMPGKKAQGENIKWTEGSSCPRDVWRPAHGPQSAQSTVAVLSSWNLDLLFQAAKGHLGQDRAYLTQGPPGTGSLSIFILNYGKWPENTVFKDDVLSSTSTGKIKQPNSAGLLGNSLFTGENLWPPLGLAFISYSLSWTSTKWSTLMGEKGD